MSLTPAQRATFIRAFFHALHPDYVPKPPTAPSSELVNRADVVQLQEELLAFVHERMRRVMKEAAPWAAAADSAETLTRFLETVIDDALRELAARGEPGSDRE